MARSTSAFCAAMLARVIWSLWTRTVHHRLLNALASVYSSAGSRSKSNGTITERIMRSSSGGNGRNDWCSNRSKKGLRRSAPTTVGGST